MNSREIELPDGVTIRVPCVQGFCIKPDGVYDEGDKNSKYGSLIWVDSKITFLDSNKVCKSVKILCSATGKISELHVANSEFVSDFRYGLIKKLSDYGCEVEFGQQKKLMEYLCRQSPINKIIAVEQMGYYQGADSRWVYVRPDRTIGETDPPIRLYNSCVSPAHNAIRVSCSLEEEKQNVTNYIVGNRFLVFAVGIAYASLMYRLLDLEGGGFHFFGHSSRGKTTLLQLIAVILGKGVDPARNANSPYIQSWDSTKFAIELLAKDFNDTALLLDELHKYSGSDLASLIYTLTGGKGKNRGSGELVLRKGNEWLSLVASSGEHSVSAAIAKIDPKKVTTGQQVRFPSILTEQNVFDNTHGMEAKDFVDMLKENCAKSYGASSVMFIEHTLSILNSSNELAEIKIRHRKLSKSLQCGAMSIEQARVTDKFAAVQLGLHLAIDQGLINIGKEEADDSVKYVLDNWLENSSMLSDIDQGIENVRTFIRTQPRRFRDANDKHDTSTNIVGYFDDKRCSYYFIPDKFEVVCGKSHTREILRELNSRSLLLTNNKDGKGNYKHVSKQSVAGYSSRVGVYAIKGSILDDEVNVSESTSEK